MILLGRERRLTLRSVWLHLSWMLPVNAILLTLKVCRWRLAHVSCVPLDRSPVADETDASRCENSFSWFGYRRAFLVIQHRHYLKLVRLYRPRRNIRSQRENPAKEEPVDRSNQPVNKGQACDNHTGHEQNPSGGSHVSHRG